jgi:DNA-directed RNA polymerase III subunit RPC8
MFVIVKIEDKLRTVPEEFDRDPEQVLIEQIELKYANKVMVNIGLFIKFLDFESVGDPYIYPAEGSAHQIAVFRMIVFRPFLGEILLGTITECNKDGLVVSLGFFEDVVIPCHFLPQPTEFHPKNSLWIWKYEGNDFEIDVGDTIRFKVKTINFTTVVTNSKGDKQATTVSETHKNANQNQIHDDALFRKRSQSIDLGAEDKEPSVMQIIGSADELGQGNPIWW